MYPEEGPRPRALEAPFSLVPAMEAVGLFDIVDLSRCRKMFAVPNLTNAAHREEEDNDDGGRSRVLAP